MDKYIQRIRSVLGSEKIIHPGARIIIENDTGLVLSIERQKNGQIGLPAGSLEEGETIKECIIREVREETGITVTDLTLIGISSNPLLETVNYPNGDVVQYFTIEFFSNSWMGELMPEDTDEIKSARFLDRKTLLNALPSNELTAFESLDYYRQTNKVLLK